ncbi:MAG: response regulator [Bacteroidales bacterium]|nr:response regulator [Bacteroidales bacterium]
MLFLSQFLGSNNTIYLIIGICLILLISLLILYFTTRKKNKQIGLHKQLLEQQIQLLKQDLTTKHDSIDLKINEKTKALQEQIENRNIALKKAEETNFLKNTFLSSMSREIRTPLSGIIGFSDMLKNEIDSNKNPEMYNMVLSIADSSKHLLELMGHIIDLSRIEAKDYDLKMDAFEVNSVLSRAIAKIKAAAEEKSLNIEYVSTENYTIRGDIKAFEKSLDLILDNAIKYTLEGKISIDFKKNDAKKTLKIIISDTGIGIDKSFLSHIFEAFRQEGTGYSRIQQGAGLGLPLAHKLINLMLGDISIESKKNVGTQVSLSVNLVQDQIETDDTVQVPDVLLHKSKATTINQPLIFIVEDDKMNRLIFEHMLGKCAEIQIAVDGDDGFRKLEKAFQSNLIFDIVLLDINLPSPWDGMMLLNEYKKKWPAMSKIPFVAQTAYAMTGDKEKFLAAGFDDYISKPIDRKELFTIIENNMHKFGTLKYLNYEK